MTEPARLRMRLMAPVPVSVCLRPGRINLGVTRTLASTVRAAAETIAEAVLNGRSWQPPPETTPRHGTWEREGPRSLYDQLHDDDLATEQALVAVRCTDLPGEKALRADLVRRACGSPRVEALARTLRLAGPVQVRLCGRGVALVELDVEVEDDRAGPEDVAALERLGNLVLQALCDERLAARLETLAAELAANRVTRERFEARPPRVSLDVAAEQGAGVRIRAGWPLWVARTLFAGGDGAAGPKLLEAWLDQVGIPDGERRPDRSNRVGSLRWLNYVLPDPEGSIPVRLGVGGGDDSTGRDAGAPRGDGEVELDPAAAWQVMRLCQALYAAAELSNHELAALIGAAFAAEDGRALEPRLRRIIWNSQTLSVQRRELQKLLNRNKRRLFDAILRNWDFESLMEDAEQRVGICRDQLAVLHDRENGRATFRTELILFGIAAIAILDATLSLSAYVRSVVANATLGAHHAELANPVVRWFAQVSTVQLVPLTLLVVGGVFWVYRRLRLQALRKQLEA